MSTYADLKVGDLMSCPDTGYSGIVLHIDVEHEYTHDGRGDVRYFISGCGPLFMMPTDEVVIY